MRGERKKERWEREESGMRKRGREREREREDNVRYQSGERKVKW